jgi:hypothetical protein
MYDEQDLVVRGKCSNQLMRMYTILKDADLDFLESTDYYCSVQEGQEFKKN